MSCAIHAVGLVYAYPNGHRGLDGIDLHVNHGERVAVLGPNGAGKTTLMLHLNGLMTGSGALEVAGVDVGPKTLPELRRRVGLVFQDPDDQLFMPTVQEDVAFGPLNMGLDRDEARERVAEALGAVRMQATADRAPYQLSMGERRRVAIATVLATHDPARVERTMLVTTHDLPLAAELCERAVILARGRVVADGPCREILADPELLGANDLELPSGFDLDRVELRPRPDAKHSELLEASRR